jgi:hypothetical protein
MNVFEFSENVTKKDIVYCIVDTTKDCPNDWNREIIKNIADWTIQNLTLDGYEVLESIDENLLLKTASKKYKYAVIFSTGTEFINTYAFMEQVEKFCRNTEFFVAGHILDRGDAYYELHNQCYIIDLEKYKSLNYPEVGNNEFYRSHTETIPNRSRENIHDDYTPLWVEPGIERKEYQHRRHGWNLLKQAFDNGLPVIVFNDGLRHNKIHYYPEDDNTFNQQINFAYNRQAFCAGTAVYPINSENDIPLPKFDVLNQLVVPASGMNWILYLDKIGFDSNTVVKFYDYSLATLEYIREVTSWDGNDYPRFAEKFLEEKFSFLENGSTIPYCGTRSIDSAWKVIQGQCDWKNLWNDIRNQIKFEFHWINLLDSGKEIDWIDDSENTLINLSNIFNYIGTSTFYGLKSRVDSENRLLEKIKNKIPNAQLIFTRRAGDGFDLVKQDYPISAELINTTDIRTLSKPSWHQNRDWSI